MSGGISSDVRRFFPFFYTIVILSDKHPFCSLFNVFFITDKEERERLAGEKDQYIFCGLFFVVSLFVFVSWVKS
jgi:hypothetical protein